MSFLEHYNRFFHIVILSKEECEMQEEKRVFIELPAFTGRNVPIAELSKAIGKDAQFIRIGLQKGILKFGYAMKRDNSSEFNYYCPDKKVWEETGYFRSAV